MEIPDRHIAWMVPVIVMLCAFGLGVVTTPLHAKPRIVDCRVPLASNQFVSVEAIGKGVVYE